MENHVMRHMKLTKPKKMMYHEERTFGETFAT